MATKPAEPSADELTIFYKFLEHRAFGQENALPARDVATLLGLGKNGDRRLRQLVHAANDAGMLVVADNAGYFVPRDPSEVEEAVGRLRSQAAEMMERARRIESLATAKFYSTQMSFMA